MPGVLELCVYVHACTYAHVSESTAWSHHRAPQKQPPEDEPGTRGCSPRPFWVLGAPGVPVCPCRTLTCAPNPMLVSPGSPFSPLNPFIPGRPWGECRELLGAGQDFSLSYHLRPHQDRPSPPPASHHPSPQAPGGWAQTLLSPPPTPGGVSPSWV